MSTTVNLINMTVGIRLIMKRLGTENELMSTKITSLLYEKICHTVLKHKCVR